MTYLIKNTSKFKDFVINVINMFKKGSWPVKNAARVLKRSHLNIWPNLN